MTTHPQQLKSELIDQVMTKVRAAVRREGEPIERFARAYYEGVAPELLLEFNADELYGAAMALWQFSARRTQAGPKIRVYNPNHEEHGWCSTHSVVEIVNDDMPFIVDSVVAALNREGLIVHLLVHPVMRVRRDAEGKLIDILDPSASDGQTESILHIEVSQRSGQAALDAIRDTLGSVLQHVRDAVGDWASMGTRVDELIDELKGTIAGLDPQEVSEGRAFLEWIRGHNFTFLGSRDYSLGTENGHDYLRIVPESGLGLLRAVTGESASRHHQPLTPDMARFARLKSLFIITKASTRSVVHRPVYMDYLGVRRFDASGNVVGERRFVGLFTSTAYNRNPRDIPLLRHKVQHVLDRSGFSPAGHNAKAMLNILETFPRDELFQIGFNELFDTAMGILHLEERQRTRLFVRRDDYARFYSCLVYIPRERYNTELRQRIEAILLAAFKGESVDFNTHVSDAPMARVHYIVRSPRAEASDADIAAVEDRLITASRKWADDLEDALIERLGEARGHDLFHRYRHAFPAGYQDSFSSLDAVTDVDRIEAVLAGAGIAMNLYRRVDAADGELRFKVFHGDAPVPLSNILPMLEHMGLKVLAERPFAVTPSGQAQPVFIHDFEMQVSGTDIDLGAIRENFQTAFAQIWQGAMESDGLNRLIIFAKLGWREIVMLRAYIRYLKQTGAAFSQASVEDTLNRHPNITRTLVALFSCFDPDAQDGAGERVDTLTREIEKALDTVANLEEDRILRRLLNLILSTVRTNYFQTDPAGDPKPYLSFKLDSRKVVGLPLPRPMVEIFVYSPRMEGVHLRGGKVARGGIRWSDRREDFRTEVLGLMKAQTVKNAVIVPVGSKGGFIVKRPPEGGRDAVQAEVVHCYETLIRGLLDLTDNLQGANVVSPTRVVRRDGDDPYLVVAADKGTATFSDIANAVAREYGFWLDDAFASGGSAGYDHKKMGITARGGWVSVERHFRELGVDVGRHEFTCIGIGDMSGDVFGNAMLRSDRMKLVGAFNHMHVFVDPNPDPEKSLAERTRLFDLPRSTWADYDTAAISKGGGVYARDLKAIKLTPETQSLFHIDRDSVTPEELIGAMLRTKVDLLWFGGIGTFIKASAESHAEVGDRANDAIRIDGLEVGARVIGEGANLGVTQRGRIEYALAGGRINTDAIDNSGGVDCSDHEVNIKILLGDVVASGDMTIKQRDALLVKMTDEVAELVLKDNYQQTQAISVMAARGPELFEQQVRMMHSLERAGRLDRTLESLPVDAAITARKAANLGLTRPEIAVLMAHGKIALYDDLLASDLPDDRLLFDDLVRYFPKPLHEPYRAALERHRLRREIIANVVTNSMVNRVGASFIHDTMAKTGFSASDVARAYAITRDAFDLRTIWRAIEGLDYKVPADLQTAMMLEAGRLVERSVFWFLRNGRHPLDVAQTAKEFRPGLSILTQTVDDILSDTRKEKYRAQAESLVAKGVPADLARRVACLGDLASACDIVRIARGSNHAVEKVGAVYFAIGGRLGLDWLRAAAAEVKADTAWQKMAVDAIIDDLFGHQSVLTGQALECGSGTAEPGILIKTWLAGRTQHVSRTDALLNEFRAAPAIDLAMLAVANRQLRTIAA